MKKWLAVTACTILLAAEGGALVGYYSGRRITLQFSANKLGHDAARAVADSAYLSRDAHDVLDALNKSQGPLCTKQDQEFLQGLLYHSHFLKEVGRIQDGKIACSTLLGHQHPLSLEMPKPDFVGGDGVKVLKNPIPFRLDKQDVTCLQAGDSYVILNPFIGNLRERLSEHLTVTVIGDHGNQPAPPEKRNVPLTAPILTRDADFRIDDILYSTRCSLRYNTCMTASLPVAEALKANIVQFRDFTIFGALAGALIGLLVCLNYRHSRGVERQLRRAIQHDKLRVVYQPVVDLATRQIIGAEALARWTDEDGLAVGPNVFVKIAEERGFVKEITKLVVRHVLREFAKTFHENPDFRVNINITVADLSDPAFPPMLERELKRAHVSPHNIGLEITESSSAREQSLIEAIVLLRRRGHRIYIDDFGTGYSSLSYLHDLSIDAIKIDRAFTQAIGTEAVTVGILPQILSMAETLNLQVVVEGIETEQQGAFFSANGTPVLAQGWLYGHPFPAQEFFRILAEDQKKASVFANQD